MKVKNTTREFIALINFLLPSFATRIFYKLLGHQIGHNSKLSLFSYVYADNIVIGNDVDIRPFTYIRVQNLYIGNNSIVSYGVQIKGDRNFTLKGNNILGVYCLINCDENVTIGYYSGIGPKSIIYTHGSFLPVLMGYPVQFKEVIIENYVWVSMAVKIMPGSYIESNCIIDPGVVLKSRLKTNTIAQLSEAVVVKKNLSRLQTYNKNRTTEHLKKIIQDFLIHYKIHYKQKGKSFTFVLDGECILEYFSENNKITLVSRRQTINYDLENFSTVSCRHRVHKMFISFLRRRWGIILSIEYTS